MTLRVSPSQAKQLLGGATIVALQSRRLSRVSYPQFGSSRELRPVVDCVDIVLPTPISTNALFANKATGGRTKSKAYREWLAEAGWRLQQQSPGCVVGPFEVEIHLPRARRHIDIDNGVKSLLDLLVKHRVTSDDSLCERLSISWQHEEPGVRVIVRAWRDC